MPRVVVTQKLVPGVVDPLEEAGYEVVVRDSDAAIARADLPELVAGADAVISLLTDRIDASVLESNPALRIVANVAAGYDNIDVEAATQQGIAVSNTPDVLTEATADIAMALMLAVARRLPESEAQLRAGEFSHWSLMPRLVGTDVSGQALGIVGLGKIGQAVARRAAHGFGMTVSYHSSRRLSERRERELGVVWQPLAELLATSDFVSVHAPLNPSTHHLIDGDALRSMKRSAILINTARGPIVDESALADALEQGWIAGAGLDVYEREPAVDPRLAALRERVVLLPHIGSATVSVRRRMAETAVANVLAALSGRLPPNLVNPGVWKANSA